MSEKKTEAVVIWTWKEGSKRFTLEVPAEVDRCPECGRGDGIIAASPPREVPLIATDICYQGRIEMMCDGKPYKEYTGIKRWD